LRYLIIAVCLENFTLIWGIETDLVKIFERNFIEVVPSQFPIERLETLLIKIVKELSNHSKISKPIIKKWFFGKGVGVKFPDLLLFLS
jgi:hypothetical protein